MKDFKHTRTVITLLVCVFSSSAFAQNSQDALSLQIGAFDLTPSIELGVNYDDNILRSAENKIDTWSRVVAPQLNLSTRYGTSEFAINYRLVDEDHFSSKEDNYTDHFFTGEAELDFNVRNRLEIEASFVNSHEERGTGFSIGQGDLLTEPDRYDLKGIKATYSYGAPTSDGRLDFNFELEELDYEINTPNYRARDRQTTVLGSTFLYRIGMATRATFDLERRIVNYDFAIEADNARDSTIDSALVGVAWDATAQTSGFAKVGYQKRDFDSKFREDFNGIDWEIGVQWKPMARANLEFSSQSDNNEANGLGDFIERDRYSAGWKHEWLERISTVVIVSFNIDRYIGQTIDSIREREDDYTRVLVSVNYQLTRWINLDIEYVYDERSSNNTSLAYNRNQFFINALITL